MNSSYCSFVGTGSVPSGIGNNSSNPNLLYIVQTTDTGTGESGQKRGATIDKRYGVDGTCYGETGYDVLTNEDLWPFPYEENIRSLFREKDSFTYSSTTWDGSSYNVVQVETRGFCTDGQTLTKYIWEYLGNPIPAEIYSGGVLTITTGVLNDGTIGVSYNQTLLAMGGGSPYVWSVSSGQLPDGLSLNSSTGAITGIPAVEGVFNFSITVTDTVASTAVKSFSVTVNQPDSTAPVISNIVVSEITGSSAVVSWDTNETATSQVEYGLTSSFGQQTSEDSGLVVSHSVTLSGLNANTLYYFRVLSRDGSLNQASSAVVTFTTGTSYAAISEGENWRYFKGISAPDSAWKNIVFDASSWLDGPSGFGYGDSDDATVLDDMQNAYSSVYIRKSFSVLNPSSVTVLLLSMDYDDGFVAYINGTEVCRAGINGTPDNATLANISHEAGTPEIFDISAYINTLQAGENVIAIEAHNQSLDSSDLSCIPELNIVLSGGSDTIAPAVVSNLAAATGTSDGQVVLTWTAPGDDGATGTAASYDIRYSTAAINDANWASATQASGEPTPLVAGTSQTMTVSGLTAGQTYYFAMKTSDEVPNTSGLSNVPNAQAKQTIVVTDTTAPYTTGHNPAASAVNVQPNTPIVVHVKDDGAGVDINTIVMRVNGVVVTPVITGTPADYTLTYTPATDFTMGQTVTVSVEAKDLAPEG
jgi:Putative Ig domain./Fibronectin type III domain.